MVALLAGIVLVIEVQSLVFSLRYQTVLQQRAAAQARQAFLAVRPQIEASMAPGGTGAWHESARVVLEAGMATEVDFFDASGLRRLSLPSAAPTEHWPDPKALAELLPGGAPLVVGPFLRPAPRILSYAAFASGGEPVLMRLSASVATLADDLRERRPLLVGHALAIGFLGLLGGLALLPERRREGSPALGAYEEAMGRLRDQGVAKERVHEAERRRLEDLVRDKEAMARAGELTAGIVHEMRNGLGTIVGYARLVEKRAAGATADPETAETARDILAECRTLETVVRRFMEFVRDEALNLAPVDLARLLERVVARESRSRPGGEVSLNGLAGVPFVVGDEELLERAFENLIRNAREAAAPGGQVELRGRVAEDGRIAVLIGDDGPGLAPGAALMRPFQTTKPGGLGLGLPIALKIVGLHEGELELRDRKPRGVEVVVLLPPKGPGR